MNYYFEFKNQAPMYRSVVCDRSDQSQSQILRKLMPLCDRVWIESSGLVWLYKENNKIHDTLPALSEYQKKEFIKVKLSSVLYDE